MEGMQHTISKTTISKDNAVVKTTASHFFACIQTQKLARDLMKREASLRPCPLRTHFFGGYKCRSLHSTLMGREVCLRPCPLRTHFFDGDRTQKFAQHLDGKGSVLCSFVTLELRGCFDVRRHWTRVKIRGV